MADATIRLDKEGEVVRMVNKEGDPEILKIMEAKDSKGNPEKESDPDFDYYTNLTEEEIAKEFQKLSPADKIRYNEWFDFHTTYQQNTGIGGTISQIVCGISNQNNNNNTKPWSFSGLPLPPKVKYLKKSFLS